MLNVHRIAGEEEFKRWLFSTQEASETSATPEDPYQFELDDLYFLYRLVRDEAVVSILEFGSGWSTLVLARALWENMECMQAEYSVRHPNPFQLMTVDASEHWQQVALSRLTPCYRERVRPVTATPQFTSDFGGYATLFDGLPSFTADLIYLDGPDPDQVPGDINGFESVELHGLPMSADLLRIEPYLWPGTKIVTDGRTANARFLRARLRRTWDVLFDPFGDRTVMRLDEAPFGEVTEAHTRVRMKTARGIRGKEGPVLT